MRRIKKIDIVALIFLLGAFFLFMFFNPTGFAYLSSNTVEYNEINVKFYGEIDKDLCILQFNRIDSQYYEGLKYISVFSSKGNLYGGYYWNGVMQIRNGCESIGTIAHELAHHRQFVNKEPYFEMNGHGGNFCKYLEEIHSGNKYYSKYCVS